MKVKELIAELQKFSESTEVFIDDTFNNHKMELETVDKWYMYEEEWTWLWSERQLNEFESEYWEKKKVKNVEVCILK